MAWESMNFLPEQKIVNEQKINIMNQSTNEAGQPEQEPDNEQKADSSQVSPSIANANVIGSFFRYEAVEYAEID